MKGKALKTKEKRGQSLAELAISLPVMLLILMGTVDFGLAVFSYSILRDAAQEGALYGSFNPANKAEIENRARNILPYNEDGAFSSPVQLRDKTIVKVEVKEIGEACQGITGGLSNSVQVNVIYNYRLFMPLIGRIIGTDTIKLTGSANNIILQPPCP